MGATALMSLGSQALGAAYAQLHTTGNNIANANTAGYSRQQAALANSASLATSSGYMGTGVTVSTVTRANNLFLTQQAGALKSVSAADALHAGLLKQLEQVFPGGEPGLGQAATQIFNAFSDLAAAPSDLSGRQAVLGRLESFASLVRSSSAQLESLQANAHSDLVGGVAEVNSLARQLARLNGQISQAASGGHAPNELLDQRDRLVSQMAEQIDLSAVNSADGSVAVFVANGQTLVLGARASPLVLRPDPLDGTRLGIGIEVGGTLVQQADRFIEGGRLGALLKFQQGDLADARTRLGQFVTATVTALNEQQGRGTDLAGAAGAALFDLAPPRAEASAGNARDVGGRPLAAITLSVADAASLKPSDYRLEADAARPGLFLLTRLADGVQREGVASGDVVDGLRIESGSPAPAAGETFLLRSVSLAAGSLAVALRDPRSLAASNPVTASLGSANTGTLSIGTVTIVAAPDSPYAALTLAFTDDAGAYELLDSAGASLGSGRFSPGEPMVWNGVSIAVNGVPRAGDSLALVPTRHPQGNNGNALAFDGLARRALVDGQTAGDAYASLFSNIGVRTQGALVAAGNSTLAAERASSALAGEVGVNIDEEAARLIQYQQSYQAAAKLLQTAQSLMEALLGAVGR